MNVNEMHLRVHDTDAFRRLAEVDPDLAREYLEQKDRADRRETNSVKLGMVTAGVVAITLIVVAGVSLVYLGWWQSIAFVAALLGGSHLLRVTLTGEWSDTSWFGRFFDDKPRKPPRD